VTRLIIVGSLAAGFAIAWWLAGRWDRRAERRWLDERLAERDWASLEHYRWNSSDGIRLMHPDPMPEHVEQAYMQALADGRHSESLHHWHPPAR